MANEILIDIRTRFIDDEQRVYIVFPGNGYRLYDLFKQSKAVFLDIPGFPIGEDEAIAEISDLAERTIVSERIRTWHLGGRPEDDLPAKKVEELSSFRVTPARQQFAGQVRNFFTSINSGDIIVVPAQGLEDEILLGEVQSMEPVFIKSQIYDGDLIPGISVEWQAFVPRSKIPSWLERKIPSPNPVRLVERERYESIFDLVYERYYYRQNFACKFRVESPVFNSLDSFLFQQIILYASALYEASNDSFSAVSSERSISLVASDITASDDIPDLRIEINSPGYIVIYNNNIVPIVAGALFALAVSLGPAEALDYRNIKVINTSDSSPFAKTCQADIAQEVLDDVNAMGYKRWQEMCEIALKAKANTNLDPGMGITHIPSDSKDAQKRGK